MDGVPAHAAVHETVELVRAARLERGVPFTNAVMRRLAEGRPDLLARLHEETATAAALLHSYPDWIAETWWRELGAAGARSCAAQNVAARDRGATPDGPRVVGVDPAGVGDERLRSGPRAAAPARRAESVRGRVSGCSISAPRRAARRPSSPRWARRSLPSRSTPAGRASWRRMRGDSASNSAWSTPTRSSFPKPRRVRSRSWTPPCSGLGVSTRGLTCAGGRGRSPTSSSICCASLPSASAREGRSRTRSARSTGPRTKRSSTRSGCRSRTWGRAGPEYRHGDRPEFLLTLPHVHGTSGFFVARLRA